MALTKIRLANKKARHEHKRKAVQLKTARQRTITKLRQKRMRQIMAEGRRESRAKRRAELDYINELAEEL